MVKLIVIESEHGRGVKLSGGKTINIGKPIKLAGREIFKLFTQKVKVFELVDGDKVRLTPANYLDDHGHSPAVEDVEDGTILKDMDPVQDDLKPDEVPVEDDTRTSDETTEEDDIYALTDTQDSNDTEIEAPVVDTVEETVEKDEEANVEEETPTVEEVPVTEEVPVVEKKEVVTKAPASKQQQFKKKK